MPTIEFMPPIGAAAVSQDRLDFRGSVDRSLAASSCDRRWRPSLLQPAASAFQLPGAEVYGIDARRRLRNGRARDGRFGRDRPAEGERRPAVRRCEPADFAEALEPLGMGAALPGAVPSEFHQAVLRQLFIAAGTVIGP